MVNGFSIRQTGLKIERLACLHVFGSKCLWSYSEKKHVSWIGINILALQGVDRDRITRNRRFPANLHAHGIKVILNNNEKWIRFLQPCFLNTIEPIRLAGYNKRTLFLSWRIHHRIWKPHFYFAELSLPFSTDTWNMPLYLNSYVRFYSARSKMEFYFNIQLLQILEP